MAAVSRGGQFVVVLCEDETHFNFVRHFLLRKGVVSRSEQIIERIARPGCGEQFVRLNLPLELDACRKQNRKGAFALLIVVTDADTHSVDEREQQLKDACSISKLTAQEGYIKPNEPVIVFIPRRNIETWLKLLDGQSVDETTNYKQHGAKTQRCKPQAIVLFNHCQQQTAPPHAVASLNAACGEYRRILPMLPQS